MHRREALCVLGATAVIPWRSPLSGRSPAEPSPSGGPGPTVQAARALSPAQLAFVTALADTILPRTDTPGALDVGVPQFVDLLLAEWYSDDDRGHLLAAIDALDRSAASAGTSFAELDAAGRAAFLATIDPIPAPTPAISTTQGAYARLKSAIVTGYLTSEPIAELLRTTPVIPGRFDGCIPVAG